MSEHLMQHWKCVSWRRIPLLHPNPDRGSLKSWRGISGDPHIEKLVTDLHWTIQTKKHQHTITQDTKQVNRTSLPVVLDLIEATLNSVSERVLSDADLWIRNLLVSIDFGGFFWRSILMVSARWQRQLI